MPVSGDGRPAVTPGPHPAPRPATSPGRGGGRPEKLGPSIPTLGPGTGRQSDPRSPAVCGRANCGRQQAAKVWGAGARGEVVAFYLVKSLLLNIFRITPGLPMLQVLQVWCKICIYIYTFYLGPPRIHIQTILLLRHNPYLSILLPIFICLHNIHINVSNNSIFNCAMQVEKYIRHLLKYSVPSSPH